MESRRWLKGEPESGGRWAVGWAAFVGKSDGMKDGEYLGLGVAVPMVVLDRTVVLAIPRTSTFRLRKGGEDGPAREHLAAVARKGFMAEETMRWEGRRENRVS